MPFSSKRFLKPRKSSFKKRFKRKPSRAMPKKSRIQLAVNRAVSKKLSGVVETKYIALDKLRNTAPSKIWTTILVPGGSPVHCWGACVGQRPTAWTSGLLTGASQYYNLGGNIFPTGPGQSQRLGNSVFMKHTNINMTLDMKHQTDITRAVLPYRFRCIAFRPKQRVRTVGQPSDPTQDLFIDEIGETFGHGDPNTEGMDIWQSMLNRRDYTILKDDKFLLTPPGYARPDSGTVADAQVCSSTGAMSKDISIRIPYDKKTTFDQLNQFPEDLNMTTGVLIFAQNIGAPSSNAELFDVSLQGNTVYQDS